MMARAVQYEGDLRLLCLLSSCFPVVFSLFCHSTPHTALNCWASARLPNSANSKSLPREPYPAQMIRAGTLTTNTDSSGLTDYSMEH